jgi:predicted neutral ceramidase superfamily lipid hydrolase
MMPIPLLAMAPPPGHPGHEQSMYFMFVWMMIWSVGFAILSYIIARQKGRLAILLALLCLIPFVNVFVFLYVALSTNKKVERQLADILAAVKSPNDEHPLE